MTLSDNSEYLRYAPNVLARIEAATWYETAGNLA